MSLAEKENKIKVLAVGLQRLMDLEVELASHPDDFNVRRDYDLLTTHINQLASQLNKGTLQHNLGAIVDLTGLRAAYVQALEQQRSKVIEYRYHQELQETKYFTEPVKRKECTRRITQAEQQEREILERQKELDVLQPDIVIKGDNHRYKILRALAPYNRDMLESIYLVQRLSDNTSWALRVINYVKLTPQSRQYFERTAHLLRTVSHPSLPCFVALFEYQSRPMMIVEWLRGQTLEEKARAAKPPLREQEAVQYVVQLCEVLAFLADQKPAIFLGKLRPKDIKVTPDGTIKLKDINRLRTPDFQSGLQALAFTLLYLLTGQMPSQRQWSQSGWIRQINPSVHVETEQMLISALHLNRQAFARFPAFKQALLRCVPLIVVNELPVPQARLVIVVGGVAREVSVDRLPFLIGRTDSNIVPSLDLSSDPFEGVSRNHALIEWSGTIYTITDLDSTNGTTINNSLRLPVRQPHPLQTGDRIAIGKVELIFHLDYPRQG